MASASSILSVAWTRYRDPVGRFFAQRVALWLAMWWGLMLWTEIHAARLRPENTFLDGWFRWESAWYLHISDVGYDNLPNDHGQRDTHYWPMYPLLLRGVGILFGGDRLLGAFVLNNGMLLGSVLLFEDFCRRFLDERVSRLAGWLLLIYPFAFYYSAGHTESAVLFFSLLTFFFGYRKKWLWAGIAAAIVGAMRASGLAAGAALGVMYLEDCQWSLKKIRPNAIFACLGALGPLGFITFLKVKFNDPFAFGHSLTAKDWGAEITFDRFLLVMKHTFTPSAWPLGWRDANDVFHVVCLAVALVLTIAGFRRFKLHVTVFSALTILVQIRFWANAGRYVAPIFPLYVVAASWLAPRHNLRFFVVSACLLFMGVYIFLYGHGQWVS